MKSVNNDIFILEHIRLLMLNECHTSEIGKVQMPSIISGWYECQRSHHVGLKSY